MLIITNHTWFTMAKILSLFRDRKEREKEGKRQKGTGHRMNNDPESN